jgi:filamentous hemagglutinin family protein
MGQQAGGNLFHSFGEFNIFMNESATFTGPESIENIISRVTGGNPSFIDGRLSTTIQEANMYFLNPAGVMFGSNASLDVSGSFHVSTADYLVLGDSGRFDAAQAGNSILTVAHPSAFGFLGENRADITIEGSFLEVPEGKKLSVTGGNVEITDGGLFAPGGEIDITSIASYGEFSIDDPDNSIQKFENLGAINISDSSIDVSSSNGEFFMDDQDNFIQTFENSGAINIFDSSIDVSSSNAGNIHIYSGQLFLDNGSVLSSADFGSSEGNIDIYVKSDLSMTNKSLLSAGAFLADGGNITLDVKNLIIEDGSLIATGTIGGNGGQIRINARKSVVIAGSDDPYRETGIFTEADGCVFICELLDLPDETFPEGDSGDIYLDVDSLTLTDGARISSSTLLAGSGGDITIKAEGSVLIEDSFMTTDALGSGNSGDIVLDAESLAIENGGRMLSNTYGEGRGGLIRINAGTVSISGYSTTSGPVLTSGIFSETYFEGEAGNIILDVNTLTLNNGGRIDASTYGEGTGGEINIRAGKSVLISGFAEDTLFIYPSGIFSVTHESAEGNAGNIYVDVGTLTLRDGGRIDTTSFYRGNGGQINIMTGESILISGFTPGALLYEPSPSGLFSKTAEEGLGGNIQLFTEHILLNNGASISAESTGTGNAGNITINVNEVLQSEHASIVTSSDLAAGGDITFNGGEIVI